MALDHGMGGDAHRSSGVIIMGCRSAEPLLGGKGEETCTDEWEEGEQRPKCDGRVKAAVWPGWATCQ